MVAKQLPEKQGRIRLKMFNICVFGLGYVGLTVSVCFAIRGFQVLCGDIIEEKVEQINKGEVNFYEPMLNELLAKAIRNRRIKATTDLEGMLAESDFSFICVGTPNKPDGSIDLSQVKNACRYIGGGLGKRNKYHVVVVKSTVVPGTTQNMVKSIIEEYSGLRVGKDFGLTVNPEFLQEGSAINDMLHPDRIIIGEYDKQSGNALENLYKSFYYGKCPQILRMNLSSAEVIKYASNAFLAMKISFINEIASLCERLPEVDVVKVAEGIGLDSRIGTRFLRAGLGFGGSCFPKDVKALIDFAATVGSESLILKSILSVNEKQPLKAVEFAKELVGSLKDKTIALLGLSFKPNTSDMREAPSLKIIDKLKGEGAKIKVYDPAALGEAKKLLGSKVIYAVSPIDAIKNAECCIIVTEWDEFKKLTPEDFLNNMRYPAIVDGRRIYDPKIFSGKTRFKAVGLGEFK